MSPSPVRKTFGWAECYWRLRDLEDEDLFYLALDFAKDALYEAQQAGCKMTGPEGLSPSYNALFAAYIYLTEPAPGASFDHLQEAISSAREAHATAERYAQATTLGYQRANATYAALEASQAAINCSRASGYEAIASSLELSGDFLKLRRCLDKLTAKAEAKLCQLVAPLGNRSRLSALAQ